LKARPLRPCGVKCPYRFSSNAAAIDPACFPALSIRFRADTPAPLLGLSALTSLPPPKAASLQYMAAGPHPRRSAGARRRGRGTCPRLAARAPALRPLGPGRARAGTGPGSTNGGTVPGRFRAETALRTGSISARDTVHPAREIHSVTPVLARGRLQSANWCWAFQTAGQAGAGTTPPPHSTAYTGPNRDGAGDSGRLPGPAGPGQRCHVTYATRGARAAPAGPASVPPVTWWSRRRHGGMGWT
jgi:hypothetical protein